jgi:hypothetical protein
MFMVLLTGEQSAVGFFTERKLALAAKAEYGGDMVNVKSSDIPVKYRLGLEGAPLNEVHEDSKQATTRLSRQILGKEPARLEKETGTKSKPSRTGAAPKLVYIAVNLDTNEVLARNKRKDAQAYLDKVKGGNVEMIRLPGEKLPNKIHLGEAATSVSPQLLGRMRNNAA